MKVLMLASSILLTFVLGTNALAQNDAAKIAEVKYAINKKDCKVAKQALDEVSSEGRQHPLYNYYSALTYDCLEEYDVAVYYYDKYAASLSDDDGEAKSQVVAASALASYNQRKKMERIVIENEKNERAENDRLRREQEREAEAIRTENERKQQQEERVRQETERRKQAEYEWRHRKNEDGYVGLDIGYLKYKQYASPVNNAIALNLSFVETFAQSHAEVDVSIAAQFGLATDTQFVVQAYDLAMSDYSKTSGSALNANLSVGILPYLVNRRWIALGVGPDIGVLNGNFGKYQLNGIDADLGFQSLFSFYYGAKIKLYLGTVFFAYYETAVFFPAVVTPKDYNDDPLPAVNINFSHSRFGLGIRID